MTQTQIVSQLREAADRLEALKLPELVWDIKIEVAAHHACREDMAEFIRAVGTVEKNGVDSTFWLDHSAGPLTVTVFAADRAQVCKKIVTQKTIPAQPAVPEHVEECVEWDCSAPLLDDRREDKALIEQQAVRMEAANYAEQKGQ